MRSEISLQLCKCKKKSLLHHTSCPDYISNSHPVSSLKPQRLNHNKLQENLVSEWSTVLEMQSTGTMLFGPAYTNSPIHHGPSQLLLFIVSWAQCSTALLWGPLSKCLSSMAVLPAEIWMVLALLDTLQREGISLAQWFSRSDTPGKERRVIGFPTLLWASSAGRACQIGARSRCWAWWGKQALFISVTMLQRLFFN